jgi:hypothetical protein
MLAGIAIFTLYAFVVFVSAVGFTHILRFPGLLVFTIVLWIATIVGGPIAAIQLWRFKRSGWTVELIVFAVGLLYYMVGFAMFRGPGANLPSIAVNTAFYLLGVIILALPSCRRTIQPSA